MPSALGRKHIKSWRGSTGPLDSKPPQGRAPCGGYISLLGTRERVVAEGNGRHGSVPLRMGADREKVPQSIRELACWVPWEQRYQGGKYCKVQVAEEPMDFDAAFAAGVGVGVIGGCYNGNYLCIVDADEAAEDERVVAELREFRTYTERSPSGKGLRLLFWSQKRFDGLRGLAWGKGLEASCARFFTVTGDRLDWSPEELRDLTDQHPTLLSGLFENIDDIRRSNQLAQWMIPPSMAEPNGQQEVWAALEHLAPWRCREYYPWVQVIWALRDGGDQFLPMAVEWSRKCPEKYQDGCVERVWVQGRRAGGPKVTLRSVRWWARQDDPVGYKPETFYEPLTDLGQGRMVARTCVGRAVYVPPWKKWVVWDGTRWVNEEDSRKTVRAVAHEAIKERMDQYQRSMRKFLDDLPSMPKADQERKAVSLDAVRKWLTRTQQTERISGAIEEAASMELVRLPHTELNQHPFLLNCRNCTIDLRTGEPKPHDPKDWLTQAAPTEWAPDARCPKWEEFLSGIFAGDMELIGWMQRFLGYCLTGDVREQVFPVLWGGGANGKSLLLDTVRFVLGDEYCSTTPDHFFTMSRNDQHPTKLATMYGRRLMYNSELNEMVRLNEEFVKRATGGDPITCRRVCEDNWTFVPTHKLVLITNHEPVIQGVDDAIWRRVKKVPFRVRFWKPDDLDFADKPKDAPTADLALSEKLKEEGPGILNWMVRGCLEWQKAGLGSVKAIQEATKEYRGEQNPLKEFFERYFVLDPSEEMLIGDVRRQYEVWCSERRRREVNISAFGKAMTQLGVTKKEPSKKYYVGLRKRRPEDDKDPGQN